MTRVEIWVQSAGLGHVTRELNLVKALQQCAPTRDFQFHFLCDDNAAVQRSITEQGWSCSTLPADLAETCEMVQERWQSDPPALFILDTVDYDRNASMVRLLEDARVLTCVVTDAPSNRVVSGDIVVNAHPSLSGAEPPIVNDTRYLLGKDYFILAPEFAAYHMRERVTREDCEKGFAFFGGLDASDFTLDFLNALGETTMRWTCLVGPLYAKRGDALAFAGSKNLPIEFVGSIPSVADALYQSDIAVIAAGNTLVEAGAVGTPCIALSQNEIQDENAHYFERAAHITALGQRSQFTAAQLGEAITALADTPERRRTMSERLKAQIDGLGGVRVAQIILGSLP